MSDRKSVTPKQLTIVLGSVAVIAVVGLWSAFADRPNLTCRGEGCSNYGFCTGRRLSCIIGSTEDCRSSKRCREDGECTLVGSECHPASQSDCKQSQSCKAKNECTFVAELQACESPRDVQKHQEEVQAQTREAASKTVAPWLALIQSAASGQQTSAALAATMATPQLEGFVVENSAPTFVAMEVGQATWKGKRLPAAIVRVTVPFVNRAAGERRAVCLVQAALHDEEFKMWRGMETFGCEKSELTQAVQQWRTTNGFAATQAWPAPPAPGVDATPPTPASAAVK